MQSQKAIWFILATLMIDAIGIGLVFPIMPDLMARVGAESTADGALWGGILMAAYAAMQFLFAPAVGGLSDRFGRKPVLIVALVTLVADYVIMALATSFWMLLIGRCLAGLAGATYITATAYMADISTAENRAANFGLIGAAFGVGFVTGPALGGLAASWHISAPFWLAAGMAAVNVIFGLIVLPESLPPDRRRRLTRRDLNPFSAIFDAFRLPALAVPLTGLFVFEFANMVYPTLWSFWLRESFGWPAALIGASLAAYGIGVALTQGGVMRLTIPRLGEYGTLVLGLVCAFLGFAGYGFAWAAWMVWALLPIAALSDMVPPTMTAMMSNRVAEDRQGLLQGVIASLGSISAVIAPLIDTGVFRIFARDDAPVYLPGAPFLFSGLLLACALPLFLRLKP